MGNQRVLHALACKGRMLASLGLLALTPVRCAPPPNYPLPAGGKLVASSAMRSSAFNLARPRTGSFIERRGREA